VTNIAGWDTSTADQPGATAPSTEGSPADATSEGAAATRPGGPRRVQNAGSRAATQKAQAPPEPPKQPEKKGFWRRLLGVFK
jgi:hypothetical protein